MKHLMDRIRAVGGIMSSADWAQTVVILIFFCLFSALIVASGGVSTTVIIHSLPD